MKWMWNWWCGCEIDNGEQSGGENDDIKWCRGKINDVEQNWCKIDDGERSGGESDDVK